MTVCSPGESNFNRNVYRPEEDKWYCTWGIETTYRAPYEYYSELIEKIYPYGLDNFR